MSERARFLVALLLTGEAAIEIDGLRRALSSKDLDRIPPHLTLVAPLNVAADRVALAERAVASAAERVSPFQLELGPPSTFEEARRVLYLRVGASDELTTIRSALGAEPFDRSENRTRAFVPHVTLATRSDRFVDAGLVEALSGYRAVVQIEQVTLMAQQTGVANHPWSVVSSFDLGPVAVVGRGGREIALRSGTTLSPSLVASVANWSGAAPSSLGDPREARYCVGESDHAALGVATWLCRAERAEITAIAVDPAARRVGVGTQLIARVELLAHRGGCEQARAAVDADSELERFLLGRGYRTLCEEPGRARDRPRRTVGRALGAG